jgi:hypothetical protein
MSIGRTSAINFRLVALNEAAGVAPGNRARGRRSKEPVRGGTSEPAPPSAADAKATRRVAGNRLTSAIEADLLSA